MRKVLVQDEALAGVKFFRLRLRVVDFRWYVSDLTCSLLILSSFPTLVLHFGELLARRRSLAHSSDGSR